jgi:hypothetical protein
MTDPSQTYIARGKTCGDWHLSKKDLVVGGDPTPWRSVFEDYFRGRLQDRYLDPIKTLQDHGHWQGEGFSIVAIQCSLLEFLESTLQGKNYRYLKRGEKVGPYEYSSSKDIFVDFLCKRQPFKGVFGQDPDLAEDFYVGVRCGLLHEARTKNGWLIRAGMSAATLVDGPGRILYRDKFQDGLLEFVAWYEKALPSNSALQEAFIRKFDALCQ